MEIRGPFEIELKVHMTDGEREAVVTYSLPVAQFPTEAVVREALAGCEVATKEQAGHTFRLMTKPEFFNVLMKEKTGTDIRFAVPGGDDWD